MFDFLKKKISSWMGKDSPAKKKSKKKEKKKPVKAKKESKTKKKDKQIAQKNKKAIIESIDEKAESKLLTKSEQETKAEVDEIIKDAEATVEDENVEEQESKGNFFTKLFKKITSSKLSEEDFNSIFEEFEITLLENNVALEAVDKIKENLAQSLVGQQVKKTEAEARILDSLKNSILSVLIEPPNLLDRIRKHSGVFTIVFFGINGTGKTTSIAKLANLLKKSDISCILAAADTFRAASIEQLKTHADNIKVPMISSQYGADPASVAFDAIAYAKKHKIKVVLIDTAGRMYTKENLMKEMEKVIRIAKPDLKFFVGESITGNDVIDQARTFNDSIGIDGIILTKADVDEKAGTILSVSHVTGKPIFFLGTGQNYQDFLPFTKKEVLKNLGLD